MLFELLITTGYFLLKGQSHEIRETREKNTIFSEPWNEKIYFFEQGHHISTYRMTVKSKNSLTSYSNSVHFNFTEYTMVWELKCETD